MDNAIKILVVEDEMIIGAKISLQLSALGYEVTGILSRGEEALQHRLENSPDIVLLDVNLKGAMDGIETATRLQKQADIPIIYLTANSDESTFNRAKETRPVAFISKPFRQLDLQRAIELTISRMLEQEMSGIARAREPEPVHPVEPGSDQPYILRDRIFIRHKDKMVKVMIEDVLYVEAERNYSCLYTKNKEYLLSVTLKNIEEKLPASMFVRIHRSYLVNIYQVDEVAESHVQVGQKAIPLSMGLKDQLMQRIRTL